MAHDENLAQRIRVGVASPRGLTEKKMFGGLAFLIEGHTAIAASGKGRILARVGPEVSEHLAASIAASVAAMRGRPVPDWLRVDAEHVGSARQPGNWVDLGVGLARSLSVKG